MHVKSTRRATSKRKDNLGLHWLEAFFWGVLLVVAHLGQGFVSRVRSIIIHCENKEQSRSLDLMVSLPKRKIEELSCW